MVPCLLCVAERRQSVAAEQVQSFINTVNTGYESVHKRFEEQFWGTKMALPDGLFRDP